MVYRQFRAGAPALTHRPALKPFCTLEETHVLASGVATDIQADCVDMTIADGVADALKVNFLLQHFSQRCIIQK